MSIQGLLQSMLKLVEVHDSLLQLAEQKKQVLIHNQVDKLNQIVNKETQLMKQVTECDQERIRAISDFLLQKGYKPNVNITTSEIAKLVFNAEEKKNLAGLQQQLLIYISKLRELNSLNQQLIEHSLAFIEYSIDIVMGPSEEDAIYSNPQHQNNGSKRNGMFDTKA